MKTDQFSDRLIDFTAQVIKISDALPNIVAKRDACLIMNKLNQSLMNVNNFVPLLRRVSLPLRKEFEVIFLFNEFFIANFVLLILKFTMRFLKEITWKFFYSFLLLEFWLEASMP